MSRLSIGVIQVYLVHKERRKFGCLRQPVNKFLIFDNKTAELESGDRKLCNTFHTFNTSYRKHEKKECYESFWYLIGILNGNGEMDSGALGSWAVKYSISWPTFQSINEVNINHGNTDSILCMAMLVFAVALALSTEHFQWLCTNLPTYFYPVCNVIPNVHYLALEIQCKWACK